MKWCKQIPANLRILKKTLHFFGRQNLLEHAKIGRYLRLNCKTIEIDEIYDSIEDVEVEGGHHLIMIVDVKQQSFNFMVPEDELERI